MLRLEHVEPFFVTADMLDLNRIFDIPVLTSQFLLSKKNAVLDQHFFSQINIF